MHEVSEWLKELIIPPTRTPAKLGTLDDYLIFNTVIGRYVQSGYGGITGVLDQTTYQVIPGTAGVEPFRSESQSGRSVTCEAGVIFA